MTNRGRKSKYTPERIGIMAQAVRDGKTHKVAASLGGISYATFYRWLDERNDFRDAIKKAEMSSLMNNNHHEHVKAYSKRKAPHKKGSGYVYLVHCDGTEYFKIGISKNAPDVRINAMQTSCPFKLHMVHVAYCDHFSYAETILHELYCKRRVRGEWFDMSGLDVGDVIESIDAYATAQIGLF